MPMPFESFRLLNGSGKDVKDVKYRASPQPGIQATAGMLPEQTIAANPLPDGQATEQPPLDPGYMDVRTLAITNLTIDHSGGVDLPIWELSYQAVGAGGEDDVIIACDLFVQPHPEGANSWYCLARLRFADGTMIDYQSPLLK